MNIISSKQHPSTRAKCFLTVAKRLEFKVCVYLYYYFCLIFPDVNSCS